MDQEPRKDPSISEIEAVKSWLLPDVSEADIIVPSLQKELKEQKKNSAQDDELDPTLHENESIETIDDNDIQPLTAEQVEEITQQAHKEGYEEGFNKGVNEGKEAGYDEGIKTAQKEIQEQVLKLQQIMDVLLIPLESEQKKLEQLILNMVCSLCRSVVQKELTIDSSNILESINSALKLLDEKNGRLNVFLHSKDKNVIEEHLKATEFDYRIQIDDTLIPGGCRLENTVSSIDATIETTMTQLFDEFLQAKHPPADQSE